MVGYSDIVVIQYIDKAAIVKELSNISKGSKAKEAKVDKIDEIRDEKDIKLLEEIQGSEDTDNFENMLPADEVLKLMLDGYQKCTNSVLANRIICRYYIYLRFVSPLIGYFSSKMISTDILYSLASIMI